MCPRVQGRGGHVSVEGEGHCSSTQSPVNSDSCARGTVGLAECAVLLVFWGGMSSVCVPCTVLIGRHFRGPRTRVPGDGDTNLPPCPDAQSSHVLGEDSLV